ncbi:MAG: GNAT family N-acetyltransferase [Bdellovibrionales bacterium]|nr:GNAT family N-acetyltransferase [Bdellovibrionales bacterium]
MEEFTIMPINQQHWSQIINLSDVNFGPNYIKLDDLSQYFGSKQHKNALCSFVLANKGGEVKGFRITFAPGHWPKNLLDKSLYQKWPYALDEVAYFKTLLVDSILQGQGWGPKLTQLSINELIKMGTKAIVCHSWKESPNNSSQRYLLKMDFKPIGEIKNFWQDKEYFCLGCQQTACICTAIEMIKIIKE